MYHTTWQTEDGLTHWATVMGNATSGFEIRSHCGLIDNASWAAQLVEDAEITCPRCRSVSGTKHPEPQPELGRVQSEDTASNGNPATNSRTSSFFQTADLIHVYTRRQAIADGVLVEVDPVAKEAGIRYPTALTRAVWDNFVRVPEGVTGQDEQGRLWDLVWVLRHAAKSSQGDTTFFYLHVRNDNHKPRRHQLKAICGPDDDGNPCITVMLPNED